MDSINCIDQFNTLAIICGSNFCIIFIDMQKRKIVSDLIRTKIQFVYTVKICELSENEILVCVGGRNMNSYISRTDILNITNLLKINNYWEYNLK